SAFRSCRKRATCVFNTAASCDLADAACSKSLRWTLVGRSFHSRTRAAPRLQDSALHIAQIAGFIEGKGHATFALRLPRPSGRERLPFLLPTLAFDFSF